MEIQCLPGPLPKAIFPVLTFPGLRPCKAAPLGWQLWLLLKEPLFINILHSQPTKREAAERGVTGRLPGGGAIYPEARGGDFEHMLGTIALGLSHWSCCAASLGRGLLGARGSPRHPAGSPGPGPPGPTPVAHAQEAGAGFCGQGRKLESPHVRNI